MSDIPRARAILLEIAEDAEPEVRARIDVAVALMWRQLPTRKAPRKSRSVTAHVAREIRAYARIFPNATQHEIGTVFNCCSGRVSEALNYKR